MVKVHSAMDVSRSEKVAVTRIVRGVAPAFATTMGDSSVRVIGPVPVPAGYSMALGL
jgi:hypothetical protein